MVTMNRLTMRNFKRFSGEHHVELIGEGKVTVIAAKNGLGKTTMMEAIHIGLYGETGYKYLFPENDFHNWLENAYSVNSDGSDCINLAIELNDPVLGLIRISRNYWILGESFGGIEDEVVVTIDGKPLEREPRESSKKVAERWIEDYLPHAAMRRFFVDGERLSDLDPKRIDREIINGIDDATGIGLLHRMRKHLDSARRSTLRTLAPSSEIESLNQLMMFSESLKLDKEASEITLKSKISQLNNDSNRIKKIQEEIEKITMDDGSENVQLRLNYAITQSELTSSRKEIHTHLMTSLPFIVAGFPSNLDLWNFDEVIESKKSEKKVSEQLAFLKTVIEDSGVGKNTRKKLLNSGDNVSEKIGTASDKYHLSNLPLDILENLTKCHSELGLVDAQTRIIDCVNDAMEKLAAFEAAEDALRKATLGTGIAEKAEELKILAQGLGTLQAEIASLKGEVAQYIQSRLDLEKRIDEIRQREDSDSLLNRRLTRIDQLDELTKLVTSSVRESFAKPLEESFREGFELLSRKSNLLKKILVNPIDYSIHLSMKGFDGNWLDRDLSATEKQHVGLALVYALRRASTEWSLPLPVIIDTPTSRMDSEHKSWSVTRFYPLLSNQVIVFATSDDLAGGLFEELSESGVLGQQLLVQEVSDNSVEVINTNLQAFFGGA
ncbi:MAG: AAA family ATPase [Euryarchaeota archaeon]|nr:AAA family ATPase [Euryarchaeota archaeon]